MVRRWSALSAAGFLTAVVFLSATAQPPTADGPKSATDLRRPQEQNAKVFRELKVKLLELAQRLERSDKPDDKEKAKTIRAALAVAEKEDIDNQFGKLIAGMSKGSSNPEELKNLLGQNGDLSRSLLEMLNVLMTDDESARLQEQIKTLERFLKEAEEIKRKQEVIRAMTEAAKGDKDKLAKQQADLAERTKQLAKQMAGGKPSDPKDAKKGEPKDAKKDGEPKESKDAKKDAKDSKDSKDSKDAKDAKKSDPKDAKPTPPKDAKPSPPKDGEPKDGEPNDGQPKASPPPPPQNQIPGRKKVEEAYPHQKKSEDELNKDKKKDSASEQDKAIEALQKAIDELKKKLKQLREEETLKTLAALEARCNRMLALQIEVYDQTKQIDAAIKKNENQPTNADRQRSQQQSDKEKEIVIEADKALQLLSAEGSAVAFAQVLQEVKGDMQAVQLRLEAVRVDGDTQAIEENIIAMLKDMIAALKKAQQDIQNQQNPNAKPSQPRPNNQRLIDLLAELRLVRALQTQVNQRTKMYGAKSPGEQANDPLVQGELRQLAARQVKLQEMIQKIATGANQ